MQMGASSVRSRASGALPSTRSMPSAGAACEPKRSGSALRRRRFGGGGGVAARAAGFAAGFVGAGPASAAVAPRVRCRAARGARAAAAESPRVRALCIKVTRSQIWVSRVWALSLRLGARVVELLAH